MPTEEELLKTLIAAAKSHHEYQTNILSGVRHKQWAGWYSAYVLGRLGDFTTPSLLSKWLEEVPGRDGWFKRAAKHVHLNISTS